MSHKLVAVVYNPKSCSLVELQMIKDAFKSEKQKAEFYTLEQTDKLKASNATVVVAVGGDGSVSSVATWAYENKKTLAILPLGTLNHFAKDLGIPLTIAAAVKVVAHGQEKKVDIVKANDVMFVNNASIGLYSKVVRTREKLSPTIGKWPAAVVASLSTLRSLRRYDMTMTIDGKNVERKSSLLFVGNNRYKLEAAGKVKRDSVTRGTLSVYVLRTRRIDRLYQLTWQVLFGKQIPTKILENFSGKEVTVSVNGRKNVHLAHDGEVSLTELPLTFQLLPDALNVIVPKYV